MEIEGGFGAEVLLLSSSQKRQVLPSRRKRWNLKVPEASISSSIQLCGSIGSCEFCCPIGEVEWGQPWASLLDTERDPHTPGEQRALTRPGLGMNIPFPREMKCPIWHTQNLMLAPHCTKEMQKQLTQAPGNFFFSQQQIAYLCTTLPLSSTPKKKLTDSTNGFEFRYVGWLGDKGCWFL